MARPEKCRKICSPPKMEGFRPYGMPRCESGSVILKFEEFESIRLSDYVSLPQNEAARQMNISRPTFTRIHNRAIKAVATAFVEGRAIEIECGNFTFGLEWYRCKKCYRLIPGAENHSQCKGCKSYGIKELVSISNNADN